MRSKRRLASARIGRRLRDRKSEATLFWSAVTGHESWAGMREPFNGQRARLSVMQSLVRDFRPDLFVETGTFIGSTTRFFCGNGAPVFTAEIKRSFRLLALLRLGWDSDVTVLRIDSQQMLRQLASDGKGRRPLVYLDAHWWSELPLARELDIVLGAWREVVVVVDDFRVEGDPGYAYDEYDGRTLSLDDVSIPGGVVAAFPAAPSTDETGARRGTLYLASGELASSVLGRLMDDGELRPAGEQHR